MYHVVVPTQSAISPRGSQLYEDNALEQSAGELIRRTYPIPPGVRMATPDKEAIMDLAGSFERRKLGKAQRVLHSMAERAREQEVAEMSTGLCRQYAMKQQKDGSVMKSVSDGRNESVIRFPPLKNIDSKRNKENKGKEQWQMDKKNFKRLRVKPRNFTGNITSKVRSGRDPVDQGPPKNDQFPARKVIKPRSRYYIPLQQQPHITFDATSAFIHYQKGVSPCDRTQLLRTRRINGPIQLDLYLQTRPDQLAPLICVPAVRMDGSCSSQTETSISYSGGPSPDRVDTYMHTGRLKLGRKSIEDEPDVRMNKNGSGHRERKLGSTTSVRKGSPVNLFPSITENHDSAYDAVEQLRETDLHIVDTNTDSSRGNHQGVNDNGPAAETITDVNNNGGPQQPHEETGNVQNSNNNEDANNVGDDVNNNDDVDPNNAAQPSNVNDVDYSQNQSEENEDYSHELNEESDPKAS